MCRQFRDELNPRNSDVIGVKTETPDFQRFPAAFVLSGVDSGVQSLNKLIVAPEKIIFIDRIVATFDFRRKSVVGDRHAFIDGRNDVSDFDLQIFEFFARRKNARLRRDVFARKFCDQIFIWNNNRKFSFRIADGREFSVRSFDSNLKVRWRV